VKAGWGAAPAGLVSQAKAPGRLGAPSGITMNPCQELADRPALRRQRKAGPAADQRRVWRAERRPPCPATGTEPYGLRFSARRSPLILRRAEGPSRRIEGLLSNPGRSRVAARRPHALCPRRCSRLPALPLWESTRAARRAVRGKRRSRVEKKITPHPSRHATCCARSRREALSHRGRGEKTTRPGAFILLPARGRYEADSAGCIPAIHVVMPAKAGIQ
jgi:hypothetical protein